MKPIIVIPMQGAGVGLDGRYEVNEDRMIGGKSQVSEARPGAPELSLVQRNSRFLDCVGPAYAGPTSLGMTIRWRDGRFSFLP